MESWHDNRKTDDMPEEPTHRLQKKVWRFLRLDRLNAPTRRILVSVVGGLMLLLGIVMLVTPGPAFVLIPLGLLILGSEFTWAQTALGKVMDWLRKVRVKWRNRNSGARAS